MGFRVWGLGLGLGFEGRGLRCRLRNETRHL